MRQRLHLARALLHPPEVLFLDEPSIGIDPVGAHELRATVGVGFWMQLKLRQASAFDSFLAIIWPLFFATSIFLVHRHQTDPTALMSAAIGTSVMGVWTAATASAAGSLQNERQQGTLELLVLSPRSFALTLVPLTLSMAVIGLYALVATLLWLRFVLGLHLVIADPAAFAVASLATALATAAMGFVLALSTVRYRSAWAIGAAVELPVWLICGFIVPLNHLPLWVEVLARLLPITWAVQAVHAAALGQAIGLDVGVTGYRALFSWTSPWIFIPSLIVTPVFQILLFAYIGDAAGVGDNRFFLVGNAIQYASIPCLFAMGKTISGERRSSTLSLLLVTPARRLAIFGGRAVPTVVNSAAVTIVALAIGAALLRVTIPITAVLPLLVVIVIAAASCTGLGLLLAAVALRVRETAVLPNVVYGVMLFFGGVNVVLDTLPTWMQQVGNALPLTHAIEAARLVATGSSLTRVSGLLGIEIGVGVVYTALGFLLLRVLETGSRRNATLELM